MRNLKKLLAVTLAGSMMLASLAGCGNDNNQETTQGTTVSTTATTAATTATTATTESTTEAVDEKPWKGMTFKVMIRDDMVTKYGPDAEQKDGGWPYQAFYHALNEWCLENECSWEQLASVDVNVMMAAIASGNGPDLYAHYGQFPLLPNLGLVQPIDDYVEELSEKYGAQYLEMKKYKEHYYGVHMPDNAYGGFQYDRTLYEEYGVKTPREYFMEGEWNWETWRTVMNEMTKDLDGDGTLDTCGANIGRLKQVSYSLEEVLADGSLKSVVDSAKVRFFAQMTYEEYSVNKSIVNNDNERATVAGKFECKIVLTDPRTMLWEQNGHIWEAVPVPTYEEGEGVNVNMFDVMIPTGAQSLEASVELMDYLLECRAEVAAPDLYDFEGLKGTTDESAAYIEMMNNLYTTGVEATKELEGYDEEYMTAVWDFLKDKSIWTQNTYSGVKTGYNEFLTIPASTAIAEIHPTHQAACETYNSLYIY
ncbi:MAG: extracellular solute-binding protein [Lachnospiraceae bacterium]|nr:extracellular solute-binding protein [Lachnospiraceae bacterium]